MKHCAMNVLYSLQHLGYVDPAAGRRRLDRRGRPGPELPRPRLGRPGERLHQPQHHVHDVEPAARRPHAQGRRRHPGPRQPALGVGRRLPLRLPEPRATDERRPTGTGAWAGCPSADLADGPGTTASPADRHTICLAHHGGDGYGALDNRCPHQGGPLGEGSIENGLLRCPWHGYDYDPLDRQPPPGLRATPPSPYPRRDPRRRRLRRRRRRATPHERTVTDLIAETLVDWGVEHVFGMVGHSNLGFADALRRQRAGRPAARTSASATRARPRSPRRPTASSPAARRPA